MKRSGTIQVVPTWDHEQYLLFAEQRTRPAVELLSRVLLDAPQHVVDLGCGPGNSTALIHQRWPAANVIGVDNSQRMLDRARSDYPDIEFVAAEAASYNPETAVDLVFANALLQWIPDHRSLLPRLLGLVRPGGVLAIQMPCNFNEPSHRLMRELGSEWAEHFRSLRPRSNVLDPPDYYDLLALPSNHLDIWVTTYQHVMSSVEDIVAWVKGTGLRPFLEVLPAPKRRSYLEAYAAALDAAYRPRKDGKRLFRFPRLFIVATR